MTDDVNTRLVEGGMQATMYDLQLTKVDRPPTYELAVDAKENAKNQIDLVTNKKQQQITSATTAKMRVNHRPSESTTDARQPVNISHSMFNSNKQYTCKRRISARVAPSSSSHLRSS